MGKRSRRKRQGDPQDSETDTSDEETGEIFVSSLLRIAIAYIVTYHFLLF